MVQPDQPAERVRTVVDPVVRGAGLHLEDVVVAPAGRRSVVRVVIDLDDDAVGALDSDRLADVSRAVSAALDASDPVKGQYVLEVSTPGTDRALTTLRHFRRARTRLVRLVLDDGSAVTGRLIEASADGYLVRTDDGERTIDPGRVVRGEVEVELSRASDVTGEEV